MHLTYKELNEQSNRLAHYLHDERNICAGVPVGLMMDRSVDGVIAILGILAAVAVPQYLKYRARSFNSQALADLRTIENEAASYYAEWDHYPF